MQFSSFTQDNVPLFINKFENCMIQLSDADNSLQNKYLTRIYNNIVVADKYLSRINKKQRCLYPNPDKIDNVYSSNFKLPSSYNTSFFAEVIRKQIIEKTEYKVTYTCKLGERMVTLDFFFMKGDVDYDKYNKFANMVFLAITLLSSYASKSCSRELHILVYLTDIKKFIPDSSITVLEPLHVNGGFTTTCNKVSEIVIFRKEEWFKVLLHECFHNLGLDFSLMNITEVKKFMKEHFPIECNFYLFETYCELWARILNACISGYFAMETKCLENFYLYSEMFLQTERLFTLFQCNKILDFMGLSFDELINDGNGNRNKNSNLLYKEKTNVFAYYIMTALFMNNYVKFFNWCDNNNTNFLKFTETQRNMMDFCEYIVTEVKQRTFQKQLYCVREITKKNSKYITKYNRELLNSSRMSLFEFIP
jgi:hypothetical protein